MASGQKSPPQFGFQGRNPNNLVSEPIGPSWEASRSTSSSNHGVRRGSSEKQRRHAEELQYGWGSPGNGWGSPQYGSGYTPAIELPPPPPPPPPDPYGTFFASPSSYYASPPVDLYQQQYATPPTFSLPPPQQQCQSSSPLPTPGYGYPSVMTTPFPAQFQQLFSLPQQQFQFVPHIFDEMPVTKEARIGPNNEILQQGIVQQQIYPQQTFMPQGLTHMQHQAFEQPSSNGPTHQVPNHCISGSRNFSGNNEHSKVDSSEQSRMRKFGNVSWCRRCKVECESMDGLVIHSLTSEHQSMTMALVLSIKQNIQSAPSYLEQPHVHVPELIPPPEVPSASSVVYDSSIQGTEADGYSIDITGLPLNATAAQQQERNEMLSPRKGGTSIGFQSLKVGNKHVPILFQLCDDSEDVCYKQSDPGSKADSVWQNLCTIPVNMMAKFPIWLSSYNTPDEHQGVGKFYNDDVQLQRNLNFGSSSKLITGRLENVPDLDERSHLVDLLHTQKLNGSDGKQDLTFVFVETKRVANSLENWLTMNGFFATVIHGDQNQYEWEPNLKTFKVGQTLILVATDVVARGLDIPHVAHVINFDLPKDIDDYVYHIGRGRSSLHLYQHLLVKVWDPGVQYLCQVGGVTVGSTPLLHKLDSATMVNISYAINYWSKGQMQSVFLRHEEAMLAIGSLAYATGPKIVRYMPEFYKYLDMSVVSLALFTAGMVWDPGIEVRLANELVMLKASGDGAYNFADALLEMMIFHLPSPSMPQRYCVENLFEDPIDDFYTDAIRNHDPEGSLMLYVSTFQETICDLPKNSGEERRMVWNPGILYQVSGQFETSNVHTVDTDQGSNGEATALQTSLVVSNQNIQDPMLSSSPAMAFFVASAFPYAGFLFGASFPLTLTSFYGGPTSYDDSSTGAGGREMLECEPLKRVWDPGINY